MSKQKSKKTIFQKQAVAFKKEWEFIFECHQKNNFSFDDSVTRGSYAPLGFLAYFDMPEEDCGLQKSQQIIAEIAGCKNWDELNALENKERELAEAIVSYCLTIETLEDWYSYRNYDDNYDQLSIEEKLSLFYSFMENDYVDFSEFDPFGDE